MEQTALTSEELAEMGWRSSSPPAPADTAEPTPAQRSAYLEVVREITSQTASTGHGRTDEDYYNVTDEVWLRHPEDGRVERALVLAPRGPEKQGRMILRIPPLSPEWADRLGQALAAVPSPAR